MQQNEFIKLRIFCSVDEIKGGFTKEKCQARKPFFVKEAKIKMECKVLELKARRYEGGAGQL